MVVGRFTVRVVVEWCGVLGGFHGCGGGVLTLNRFGACHPIGGDVGFTLMVTPVVVGGVVDGSDNPHLHPIIDGGMYLFAPLFNCVVCAPLPLDFITC